MSKHRCSLGFFLSFVLVLALSGPFLSVQANIPSSRLRPATPFWYRVPGGFPLAIVFAQLHSHNHIDGIDHFGASPSVLHETQVAYELGLMVTAQTNHAEAITPEFWDNQLQVIETFNDTHDHAVALSGAEWTSYGIGPQDANKPSAHVNVFNSPIFIGTSLKAQCAKGRSASSLDAFYDTLIDVTAERPTIFAQFNHPWAGNFHFNYGRRPRQFNQLRTIMSLIEIDSGEGNNFSHGLVYYNDFLQHGWPLAPTCCNDTAIGITSADLHRCTGIWTRKTTTWSTRPKEAVLEAVAARRVYAQHGPGSILFGAENVNGQVYMGDTLVPDDHGNVVAELMLLAPNGLVFPKVSIVEIYPDHTREQSIELDSTVLKKQLLLGCVSRHISPGQLACYAIVRDGSFAWVSAPIWFTRNL